MDSSRRDSISAAVNPFYSSYVVSFPNAPTAPDVASSRLVLNCNGDPDSRTCVGFSEAMLRHHLPQRPSGHVERPDRVRYIWNRLVQHGLIQKCALLPSRSATQDELLMCHSVEYVTQFMAMEGTEKPESGDIYFNTHTVQAALLSAGVAIDVACAVARGQYTNGFAIVRPPGHHAASHDAMGFCHLSNVAIAARAIQKYTNLKNVLIVDWDVHHGNGTQDILYNDDSILFFSVHGYKNHFYPDSGHPASFGGDKGTGYNINIPWPSFDVGDDEYMDAWNRVLLPVARVFKPDIVIVSAGFDAAAGDPLGSMRVTPFGFSQLLRPLQDLCNGKVVLILEGGYNLLSIGNSSEACLRTLLGMPVPEQTVPSHVRRRETCSVVIDTAISLLRKYWPTAFPSPIDDSWNDWKVRAAQKLRATEDLKQRIHQQQQLDNNGKPRSEEGSQNSNGPSSQGQPATSSSNMTS